MRRRSGFTLIELLVVIVLFSLLAATAAVVVRLPLAKAKREHAIEQVRVLDSIARDRAQRGQQVRLEFDAKQGVARVIDHQHRELVSPVVVLSGQDTLVVLGADERSDAKRHISYDKFGTSKTFAVHVGPSEKRNNWLLVLGMTGQSYSNYKRGTVNAIINGQRHRAR